MARTLLSFQPDNEDERLRSLMEGGNAPLADAPAPAPDEVPNQDQGADSVGAHPEPEVQPMAAAPQPPPPSREDQILQMLMDARTHGALADDPEREARWKKVESDALDRADFLGNQNNHYGLGEFARDNGAALLASALDVGFNKGRGLGSIVGATAQGVGQQEAERQAQAEQARQFALKIHQQRGQQKQASDFQSAYQLASIADRMRGHDITQQGQTGVQGRAEHNWAQKESPEAAQQRTAVEVERRKAEASTNATTDALRGNPRAITPQQEAQNALDAQARAEAAQKTRQSSIDTYNDKEGDAISIMENARKLQELADAHPDDLPGVGMWDANKPDFAKSPEDIQAQQLFAQFSNPQFKDIAGRAVTGAEQARVLAQVGNLKSSNEETVRNAVRSISDSMANRLRSGAIGREDIAREILAQHGLDDLIPQAPQPSAAPNASTYNQQQEAPQSAVDALPQEKPNAYGFRPETIADPANLGGTSKRGAKNADFAGPDVQRNYTLKLPSGRSVKANLNAEQLDLALRNGAELQ